MHRFFVLGCVLVLAACGGDGGGGSTTPDPDPVCEGDERRCVNTDVEVCQGGQWVSLGECPSGTECSFGDCVAACTASCDGAECGDDGCGGSCGSCDDGESCQNGACVEEGGGCGNDSCDDDETCATCPADCGACCGDGTCDEDTEDCTSCPTDCGSCCGDGTCDEDTEDCTSCPSDCGACCGDGTCDDTDEDCGNCPSDCGCEEGDACTDGVCACDPVCDGRQCGSDSCGGLCGPGCDEGLDCNDDTGQCGRDCAPQCDGRECGSDGCEGECGPGCDGDEVCNSDGICEAPPARCGDDSCGDDEDCATCPQDCGSCCGNDECQPNQGENCETCPGDCGQCCGDDACEGGRGENCSTCPADCGCGEDELCDNDAMQCVCAPQCEGRVCGSNGCGGSCGDCDDGFDCNGNGRCVELCVPQCTGRDCGSDGCDGVCGLCDDDETCREDGQCIPEPRLCDCENDETCVDGICRANELVCSDENRTGLCDAGNDCFDGDCRPNGSACSQQNPVGVCPVGQVCRAGECEEIDSVALCDDGNACTADVFDALRNRCVHTPQNVACTDGNACTTDTCQAGVCVADRIQNCVEPPELDPYVTPTNQGTAMLTGTKPAGASVQINDLEAVPESPDETWTVTLNLAPGENVFRIWSVDQGQPSAVREITIVFDIVRPTTRVTPGGGVFLRGVAVTIASDEPATVYYTTDGATPGLGSPTFDSVREIRIFDDTKLQLRSRDRAGNWEQAVVVADFEITGEGNGWSDGTVLAEPVTLAAAASTGDAVYVSGGSDGLAPQAGVHQYDVEDDAWSTMPSLPGARAQHAMVAIGGRLLVFGGEDDGTPLNATASLRPGVDDAWVTHAPMLSTRYGTAAVAVGNNVWVLGGKGNGEAVLDNVEVYNSGNDTWRNNVEPLPRARYGLSAAYHDGFIYVLGGEDAQGVPIAAVDRYEIDSNQWSTVAELPTPRSFASAGVQQNAGELLGGYVGIVLAGGLTLGGTPTVVVEEYIIDDNVWRTRTPLNRPRHGAASVTLRVATPVDDEITEIWTLGGQVAGSLSDTVARFRRNQDHLRRVEPLPAPRFRHAVAAVGETLYVLGGRAFQEETEVIAYDAETGYARTVAPLPTLQNGAGAAVVRDQIYLVGGANGFGNPVPTTRVYDDVTDVWTELSPMTTARIHPAVVALNGNVWVIGGTNGGSVQSVEIFNPVAGTWTAGPALPVGRAGAMAVVYAGEIYVIGGRATNGSITRDVLLLRNGQWLDTGRDIVVADGVAVRVHEDQVVVLGGFDGNGIAENTVVWSLPAGAPLARMSLHQSRQLMAGAVLNGEIYLVGGNTTVDGEAPGLPLVEKLRGACFNGRMDGRETEPDRGGGCAVSSAVYSQNFSGNINEGSVQCREWNTWRGRLDRPFSQITIRGSRDEAGHTCRGTAANTICAAIRSGTDLTINCDGRSWFVAQRCGSGVEVTTSDSRCHCNSTGYTVRPCTGNDNWGGIQSESCGAPAQRMDVICQ